MKYFTFTVSYEADGRTHKDSARIKSESFDAAKKKIVSNYKMLGGTNIVVHGHVEHK